MVRPVRPYAFLHGVAPDRVYSIHVSPRDGCALTAPFHPCSRRKTDAGGISLLHLSEGHPWRALPVILALWSPDFPHAEPFGFCPRSFGLLAKEILRAAAGKVNKKIVFDAGKGYNAMEEMLKGSINHDA